MPFTRNRGPGIHCRGNLINLRCKTKYSNQQSPVNGLTLNIWCAYKYSPFAPKLFHPWGQHLASTCWPVNSWSYSNEGRHHGLLHAPERKPMCCHHDWTSWRWWNIPSQQPTFPQLPDETVFHRSVGVVGAIRPAYATGQTNALHHVFHDDVGKFLGRSGTDL